ncbi:uncharacterized protein [Periplaneta americana]|uniref:uncharacterized protein n=1 Tax=Periplaneta americana TaxID=6978 RepID=UPI0037E99145
MDMDISIIFIVAVLNCLSEVTYAEPETKLPSKTVEIEKLIDKKLIKNQELKELKAVKQESIVSAKDLGHITSHEISAKSAADHKLAVKTVSLRIEKKNTEKHYRTKYYKSKAHQHEYYFKQFTKRSEFLEKRALTHKEKADKFLKSARRHELKAKEYIDKSKSARKTGEHFHSMAGEFLSQSKSEMRSYALADAESREAAVLARGYETEAKDHFIWAADLRSRAQKLIHIANLHKKYALEADHNAKKLKTIAEQEEKNSKLHLDKAQKFESKHLQSDVRAKGFFNKYEDYLLKSRLEKNTARQSKIKALYEEELAKAYDQMSLEMKAIGQLEESEVYSLKRTAHTAGKTAKALEKAAFHVIKSDR